MYDTLEGLFHCHLLCDPSVQGQRQLQHRGAPCGERELLPEGRGIFTARDTYIRLGTRQLRQILSTLRSRHSKDPLLTDCQRDGSFFIAKLALRQLSQDEISKCLDLRPLRAKLGELRCTNRQSERTTPVLQGPICSMAGSVCVVETEESETPDTTNIEKEAILESARFTTVSHARSKHLAECWRLAACSSSSRYQGLWQGSSVSRCQ